MGTHFFSEWDPQSEIQLSCLYKYASCFLLKRFKIAATIKPSISIWIANKFAQRSQHN